MPKDEETDIMREFQQEVYTVCEKRIKHIEYVDNESEAKEALNSSYMCAGVLLKTAIELYTIGLPDAKIASMLDLAKQSIPQLRDGLDLKPQTVH